MLFMNTFRWEPGMTAEVLAQRAKDTVPEGMRVLNEWTVLSENMVFRLVDIQDPAAMLQVGFAWADLGYIEMYPVMETAEVLKYLG
jgi:hypothetical protein